MPEYSFTMEFAEEVARRFAAGDTISEIAGDTYNPSEDIEELLRVQIRRRERYCPASCTMCPAVPAAT